MNFISDKSYQWTINLLREVIEYLDDEVSEYCDTDIKPRLEHLRDRAARFLDSIENGEISLVDMCEDPDG